MQARGPAAALSSTTDRPTWRPKSDLLDHVHHTELRGVIGGAWFPQLARYKDRCRLKYPGPENANEKQLASGFGCGFNLTLALFAKVSDLLNQFDN